MTVTTIPVVLYITAPSAKEAYRLLLAEMGRLPFEISWESGDDGWWEGETPLLTEQVATLCRSVLEIEEG